LPEEYWPASDYMMTFRPHMENRANGAPIADVTLRISPIDGTVFPQGVSGTQPEINLNDISFRAVPDA
jgi:hypothetical protein